jgi:hypothetical protein
MLFVLPRHHVAGICFLDKRANKFTLHISSFASNARTGVKSTVLAINLINLIYWKIYKGVFF